MANKYKGVTPRGNSIQIAFTYNGERRRETLSMPPTPSNLKYANDRLGELRAKIARGEFDYAKEFPGSKAAIRLTKNKGKHISIETALKHWLREAGRYCQFSTMRGYSSAVYYYLIPRFGHLSLEDLNREDVVEWLETLEISNKRKNNTLIPLRQTFEHAFLEGHIMSNPMQRIKNLPVKPKEPKPFTKQEIRSILNQLHGSNKNLIQFAFWTGLRTSELIALKWENVDIPGRRAHIREAIVEGKIKGTKTTSGVRTIDIHPSALEALVNQYQLGTQCPYVFYDCKTKSRWKNDQYIRKRIWIPALQKAGIDYRNPYQTRHTYASMMFCEGRNLGWLQNQLGHRDWGMIRKVYARWIKE